MTPTQERTKILELYSKAIGKSERVGKELAKLREKLSTNCQHELRYDTKYSNDNGYGRWWYDHVSVCRFCGDEKVTGRSDWGVVRP